MISGRAALVWHNRRVVSTSRRRREPRLRAGTFLLLPAVCLALLTGVAPAPALSVENAWVRATPGVDVAAAYMTLHNGGNSPLVVVAVRSPLAAAAMIHETRTVRGESTMRPHERLLIAAGASVVLAPGGLHVMLQGLAHPLAVGEQVPLELLLAGGGRVTVSARVRPLNAE
jgi:periplasmic copper chaperone A